MPAVSLYNLLFMHQPCDDGYSLDENMRVSFEDELGGRGINPFVANALVTAFCRTMTTTGSAQASQVCWKMWECTDKDNVRRSSTERFRADGVFRYLFEYRLGSVSILLMYERLDSFSLSMVAHNYDTHQDLELDPRNPRLLEAIAVMLFAIMRQEGQDVQLLASIDSFRTEYEKMFPNKEAAFQVIDFLYTQLEMRTNPVYESEAENFFTVAAASPTALCAQLMSNTTIGQWLANKGKIAITPQVKAELLVERDGQTERWDSPIVSLTATGSGKQPAKKMMEGCYSMASGRTFTSNEAARILTIPKWYVESKIITNIAKAIYESNQFDKPIRNVLLRGDSGAGKTEGVKAISSMLELPYGHLTCHRDFEQSELLSKYVPRTESGLETLEEKVEFYAYAMSRCGMKLPDYAVISAMPDAAYEMITGREKEDATAQECMEELFSVLHRAMLSESSIQNGSNPDFEVTVSDLVMALEHGWLCEVQEPGAIRSPGVLISLNSILEHGTLTLTNGKILRRHPQCVIAFTNNYRKYAGVNATNQSTQSRFEIKKDLPLPTTEEMVQRLKMHVPQLAENHHRTIVTVIETIPTLCPEEIRDGCVGPREAQAWAKMAYIFGDLMEGAEYTLLPSCTEDLEDQEIIRENVLSLVMGHRIPSAG